MVSECLRKYRRLKTEYSPEVIGIRDIDDVIHCLSGVQFLDIGSRRSGDESRKEANTSKANTPI